ncbi:MAG TPA: hypothetical protein QF601_04290 [Dehalococcoidia bacterium]|nr:hypothetical protein [Dehalococcoidia bacterium]
MNLLKMSKSKKRINYEDLPSVVLDENPIKTKNQKKPDNLSFIYLMQIK